MLTWLHPYAVTDELLSRTDEKLDCLHVSNIANGNLNSMCQKALRIKMLAIIATFYVSMACQQGFCIKLWPMGKGWACETVISLIYQAGHLMTDNFNFSVKLADWLLKHPSLLTGMVLSGYLLLEPSTVVLLLHSSSFQAAKRAALAKFTALHIQEWGTDGCSPSPGQLSLPLWKGSCVHEKIEMLGGCVPRAQAPSSLR